jgi:hypothetical protein
MTKIELNKSKITGGKLEQELVSAGLPTPVSVYTVGNTVIAAWPNNDLTAPQIALATSVINAHIAVAPRTERPVLNVAQDVVSWIAAGADAAERQARLVKVASAALACAAMTRPGLLKAMGISVDNDN